MNKEMIAIYNDDNSCVEVYVNKYAKKPKISIYTPLVEDSLNATPYALSQLQKLCEDNPMEYAELVLNGEMECYIKLCKDEAKTFKKLGNEFLMYDS